MISPELRVRAAWWLLWASVLAWPITQLTVARSEPPFVLGLSWFAVILTALGIIATTDVRAEQDEPCPHCGKKRDDGDA